MITPTVCVQCGNTYVASRRGGMFCSQRCKILYRITCTIRTSVCATCGVSFTHCDPRRRFCGQKCKNAHSNGLKKFTTVCVACGKGFIARSRNIRFCSPRCSAPVTVPTRQLVCIDCGATFEFKGRTKKLRCETCWKKHRVKVANKSKLKRDPTMKIGAGSGGAQWRENNHAWNPDSRYHD